MKKYFWILCVLGAATFIRLYNLTSISLWHDEAFSALMIRYPWHEMFYRLSLDVHPPVYYIALRMWHYVAGDSLWALRGFSLLFGVLTVWAVWLLVKEAFQSEKMALWAALLVALNPFQANYVTEARMYNFGAFFAVLAAYFLVKALKSQLEVTRHDEKLHMPNLPEDLTLRKKFILYYLLFALCCGLIDLTHYYLLFTTIALCAYALLYHIYHYRLNLKRYYLLLTSYFLLLVLFLPWLKQFIFQFKQVGAGYWIPKMDIWSIPSTLWQMFVGIDHGMTNTRLVLLTLFSIFFFVRFIQRTQKFEKWLFVFMALAPFAGATLFEVLARARGSHSSVYQVRYFLFSSIFYSIILAAWLSEIKTKNLGYALLLLYCSVNVWAVWYYWQGLNINARPGMSAAAKFLDSNVARGNKIIVGTSFEFFNYKYYASSYYPGPVPPLLYTGGRGNVNQISHIEGVAMLANADLQPDFKVGINRGDTVWLIWTNGFSASKPDMPNNYVQVDEQQFPDIRPYLGTTIYVDEYKVN